MRESHVYFLIPSIKNKLDIDQGGTFNKEI